MICCNAESGFVQVLVSLETCMDATAEVFFFMYGSVAQEKFPKVIGIHSPNFSSTKGSVIYVSYINISCLI